MPVEFLTDDEAAAYGRYAGPPSRADLERVFFLDDEDRKLVDLRRGDHMKAGFAVQLVTVRWLGTFLEDPLDVPGEVLDFVAGQLGIADPAVVKRYTERVKTKSDHQQEIRRKCGLRDFADAEAELAEWVAARAWTSGDGPKAIFPDAMTWLRDRKVRDGHPTALGEAIAMYGRIFKTLHILSYIDTDETYRRDIKGIRNLQEGRHALARKICHGRKGELYHRYERGLENQLGALGLVLNCVVLWTTVYLDATVRQLRAQGYPVLDEDMARLSPFVSRHLGVHGTYSFVLPDLAPGAIRELRNPDAADEDDE